MKSHDELAARREARTQGLAVRPDVLTTRFAARVAEVDPDRAVLVLKAACEVLLRRMREVHPGATLRMTGLDISRDASAKSRDELSTRVDAEIDLPLTPDTDWWNRAQLAAAVTVLSRTLSIEARKQKPVIEVLFQQPVALVKDPDRYRAEVLRRWVGRAKELAELAQSAACPLHVMELDPPGDVTQTPVSMDEVRLTIELRGRVDAAPSE